MNFTINKSYKKDIERLFKSNKEDATSIIEKILNIVYKSGFIEGYFYNNLRNNATEQTPSIDWINEANDDIISYKEDMKSQIIRNINDILAQVDEVDYIYLFHERYIFHIWTIIKEMKIEAMEQIYEKEIVIYNLWPDISFEFHLLIQNDRPLDNLPISGSEQIYARINK